MEKPKDVKLEDLNSLFARPEDPLSIKAVRLSLASPGMVQDWSLRRSEKARDHQLPHLQTGAGRAILRQDIRSCQGLRVQLRQIQAHEAPGHHLREVRRRGDSVQGAPGAYGPHRARLPGGAHLVFEESPQQDRQPPRRHPQRPGEDPVLRGVRGGGPRGHQPQEGGPPLRGEIPPA